MWDLVSKHLATVAMRLSVKYSKPTSLQSAHLAFMPSRRNVIRWMNKQVRHSPYRCSECLMLPQRQSLCGASSYAKDQGSALPRGQGRVTGERHVYAASTSTTFVRETDLARGTASVNTRNVLLAHNINVPILGRRPLARWVLPYLGSAIAARFRRRVFQSCDAQHASIV